MRFNSSTLRLLLVVGLITLSVSLVYIAQQSKSTEQSNFIKIHKKKTPLNYNKWLKFFEETKGSIQDTPELQEQMRVYQEQKIGQFNCFMNGLVSQECFMNAKDIDSARGQLQVLLDQEFYQDQGSAPFTKIIELCYRKNDDTFWSCAEKVEQNCIVSLNKQFFFVQSFYRFPQLKPAIFNQDCLCKKTMDNIKQQLLLFSYSTNDAQSIIEVSDQLKTQSPYKDDPYWKCVAGKLNVDPKFPGDYDYLNEECEKLYQRAVDSSISEVISQILETDTYSIFDLRKQLTTFATKVKNDEYSKCLIKSLETRLPVTPTGLSNLDGVCKNPTADDKAFLYESIQKTPAPLTCWSYGNTVYDNKYNTPFFQCLQTEINKCPLPQFKNSIFSQLNAFCATGTFADDAIYNKFVPVADKLSDFDALLALLAQEPYKSQNSAYWKCFVGRVQDLYPLQPFPTNDKVPQIAQANTNTCSKPTFADKLKQKEIAQKFAAVSSYQDVLDYLKANEGSLSSDYLKCLKTTFENLTPIAQFSDPFKSLNQICDSKAPSFADKVALQKTVSQTTATTKWSQLYETIRANKLDQSASEFQKCFLAAFQQNYPVQGFTGAVKLTFDTCRASIQFQDKQFLEQLDQTSWDAFMTSLAAKKALASATFFTCFEKTASETYPTPQFTAPLFQRLNANGCTQKTTLEVKKKVQKLVDLTKDLKSFNDIFPLLTAQNVDVADPYVKCLIDFTKSQAETPQFPATSKQAPLNGACANPSFEEKMTLQKIIAAGATESDLYKFYEIVKQQGFIATNSDFQKCFIAKIEQITPLTQFTGDFTRLNSLSCEQTAPPTYADKLAVRDLVAKAATVRDYFQLMGLIDQLAAATRGTAFFICLTGQVQIQTPYVEFKDPFKSLNSVCSTNENLYADKVALKKLVDGITATQKNFYDLVDLMTTQKFTDLKTAFAQCVVQKAKDLAPLDQLPAQYGALNGVCKDKTLTFSDKLTVRDIAGKLTAEDKLWSALMDNLQTRAATLTTDFTKCFWQEARRQAPVPSFTKAAYSSLNGACNQATSDYYTQQKIWGEIIKKVEAQTPDSIVLVYQELSTRNYLASSDAFWQCQVSSVRAKYPTPTLDAKFESSKTACAGATFDDKVLLESIEKVTDWKALMQQIDSTFRPRSSSSEFLRCFITNLERNYPRVSFSNPRFTKIDTKCVGISAPTYADKLQLEKLEERTKSATEYDAMMDAIVALGLDKSTAPFFQCIVVETKANYPRAQFTNAQYTGLNAVCEASLLYADKLVLKKFIAEFDQNKDYYQLIDRLESAGYAPSSDFFKCLVGEVWKIATPVKFGAKFDSVNTCVTGAFTVPQKQSLYQIYKLTLKFTINRQFLDTMPSFKQQLPAAVYDCFISKLQLPPQKLPGELSVLDVCIDQQTEDDREYIQGSILADPNIKTLRLFFEQTDRDGKFSSSSTYWNCIRVQYDKLVLVKLPDKFSALNSKCNGQADSIKDRYASISLIDSSKFTYYYQIYDTSKTRSTSYWVCLKQQLEGDSYPIQTQKCWAGITSNTKCTFKPSVADKEILEKLYQKIAEQQIKNFNDVMEYAEQVYASGDLDDYMRVCFYEWISDTWSIADKKTGADAIICPG